MAKETDTTIHFSGLKSGSYDYDFELGREFFEGFENENLCDGDIKCHIEMERKEHLLLFQTHFEGNIVTQCDRCLGEMQMPVSGDNLLTVRLEDSEGDTECEDEDVVTLPSKESKIDLAQWLYENIAVAMPMQHLHPLDSNGQPTCDSTMLHFLDQYASHQKSQATDDPRWAKLKELLDAPNENDEERKK